MRLDALHHGHRPLQRLQMTFMRLLVGRVPGPIAVMSYRRELFGARLASCFQEAMRGPSQWSIWEREIFAAFVSRLNQCEY
jgi:hypothetical protein